MLSTNLTEISELLQNIQLIDVENPGELEGTDKDIFDCIAELNKTYCVLSRGRIEEIAYQQKKAHDILHKLSPNKQFQADQFREALEIVRKLYRDQSPSLEKLHEHLQKEQNKGEQRGAFICSPQRFEHLNAAELAVLSDVVSAVRKYLQKLKGEGKQSQKLDHYITQLNQIVDSIVGSMQLRNNSNSPKSEKINLELNNSILDGSFINVQKDKDLFNPSEVDSNLNGAMPKLPMLDREFVSLNDYFEEYINSNGDIDNEPNSWLPKIDIIAYITASSAFQYFHPENNPYIGLIQDGVNAASEAVGAAVKDVVKIAQKVGEEVVDQLRGNWVAKYINDFKFRLEQNQNFIEIEQDLANKKAQMGEFYKRLLSEPASQIEDNKKSELNKRYRTRLHQLETIELKLQQLEGEWLLVSIDEDQKRSTIDDEIKNLQNEANKMVQLYEEDKKEFGSLLSGWIDGGSGESKDLSISEVGSGSEAKQDSSTSQVDRDSKAKQDLFRDMDFDRQILGKYETIVSELNDKDKDQFKGQFKGQFKDFFSIMKAKHPDSVVNDNVLKELARIFLLVKQLEANFTDADEIPIFRKIAFAEIAETALVGLQLITTDNIIKIKQNKEKIYELKIDEAIKVYFLKDADEDTKNSSSKTVKDKCHEMTDDSLLGKLREHRKNKNIHFEPFETKIINHFKVNEKSKENFILMRAILDLPSDQAGFCKDKLEEDKTFFTKKFKLLAFLVDELIRIEKSHFFKSTRKTNEKTEALKKAISELYLVTDIKELEKKSNSFLENEKIIQNRSLLGCSFFNSTIKNDLNKFIKTEFQPKNK